MQITIARIRRTTKIVPLVPCKECNRLEPSRFEASVAPLLLLSQMLSKPRLAVKMVPNKRCGQPLRKESLIQ